MTYEQAYAAARKAGFSKATGLPLIALTARYLADAHPGLSAALVYRGAVKRGVAADQLRKMSGLEAADLMWEL